MKNVLCFGDSNTCGYIPITEKRLPRAIRWTGLLQNLLGEDYYVIEAGLNGRTFAMDDLLQPYRNSLRAVRMILMQSDPLDMITVMLGTNDTKNYLNQNAFTIAKGLRLLLDSISSYYSEQRVSRPKILVVGPIDISENIENLPTGTEFDLNSSKKIKEYRKYCEQIAAEYDCSYFDASTVAKPSQLDGIHMTEEGHAVFAHKMDEIIRNELN